MNKFLPIIVAALALPACTVVDQARGTGEAAVVAVDLAQGCSVTFRVGGKGQLYYSNADSFPGIEACKRLKPGMVVPVVIDPIYGDYPYVPFEVMGR